MEGEHLNSTNDEREHTFEGEYGQMNADVEGGHLNVDPIVEGEQNGSQSNNFNIQTDVFHNMTDNVMNAGEGSETQDMFEDVPLYFDHAYSPMDRWT